MIAGKPSKFLKIEVDRTNGCAYEYEKQTERRKEGGILGHCILLYLDDLTTGKSSGAQIIIKEDEASMQCPHFGRRYSHVVCYFVVVGLAIRNVGSIQIFQMSVNLAISGIIRISDVWGELPNLFRCAMEDAQSEAYKECKRKFGPKRAKEIRNAIENVPYERPITAGLVNIPNSAYFL